MVVIVCGETDTIVEGSRKWEQTAGKEQKNDERGRLCDGGRDGEGDYAVVDVVKM